VDSFLSPALSSFATGEGSKGQGFVTVLTVCDFHVLPALNHGAAVSRKNLFPVGVVKITTVWSPTTVGN
jgi:hypothetical protein